MKIPTSALTSLIDMYVANLRTPGATVAEPTLGTCGADNPYGDDVYEGGHDHQHGCSAGGNRRSLLVVSLRGMIAIRRRRRR